MPNRKFPVRNADGARTTLFMTEKRIAAGSYLMSCELAGLIKGYSVYRFTSDWGDKQWMVDRSDRPCLAQCDTLDGARSSVVRDLTGLRFDPAHSKPEI
jgi:hypothetical protein